MWRDIRYGVRRLTHQRLFSLSVVLLLAIAIGSNTIIFGFLNSLLLKPLPVRHPGNLYLLQQVRKRQVRPDTAFFYRQYEVIRQHREIFSAAVAEEGWTGNSFQALSLPDGVHPISTQIVSPDYFTDLGVQAILGRVLDAADVAAGGDVPVVISEQCWRRNFQHDPNILNRVIRIRNAPFLIVGVLPREFHRIDADRVPDVRLPISAAPLLTGHPAADPGGDYPLRFQVLARLAPGKSAAPAASALTPIVTQIEPSLWSAWYARSSKPFSVSQLSEEIDYARSYRISILPAGLGVSRLREQFSRAVVLLMIAAALLLVVVCANLAGLFLARSVERNQEIGVRLSLGASRWQLVRQLYTEYLLLAIPGVTVGIFLSFSISPFLLTFLPTPGGGRLRASGRT